MGYIERYKLIFEHFKLMENRYHTWMNYYSLFNGALLVAYCTILVSTGKVIEGLEGGGPDGSAAQTVQGGTKVFYLNCTYWDILIALLGVVAIGHGKWIENWRMLLQGEDNDITRHNASCLSLMSPHQWQAELVHFTLISILRYDFTISLKFAISFKSSSSKSEILKAAARILLSA